MQQSELLEAIENEAQYSPDVARFDRDLIRVLNRAYGDVLAEAAWPFLLREAPLWVYPDITLANSELVQSVDGGLVENSHRVFFFLLSSVDDTNELYASPDDNLSLTQIAASLYDAEVGLANPALRGVADGNWGNGPFSLDHITLTGLLLISFYLEPRARILTITGNEGSFKLSWPRYRLPPDCDELVEIRNSRGQRLRPMDIDEYRRRVHQSATVPVGTLDGFVQEEGRDLQYPPTLHALTSSPEDFHTTTGYGREVEPITKQITVTESAGAGYFTDTSRTYRIFVTWYRMGMYGPPSNVVEFRPTGAVGSQITIGNLPQLPPSSFVSVAPAADYGWRIAVWVADTVTGSFRLFDTFAAVTTSMAATIVVGQPVEPNRFWKHSRYDEVVPPEYRFIRFYPRPPARERLVVRYIARPRQLLDPTDRPVKGWGDQYHQAIIWRACMNLASRWSGSEFYIRCSREYEKALDRMRARYQPGERFIIQKGMIGQRDSRSFPRLGVTYGGP